MVWYSGGGEEDEGRRRQVYRTTEDGRVREECDERKDKTGLRRDKEGKVTSHAQAQAYTTQERARQCEPKQKDDGRHGGQGLVDQEDSRLS